LGGQHQKGVRQSIGGVADGHLLFLHGLQKCGLHLGRGPVDFIGKNNIVEQRAFTGNKIRGFRPVDLGTGQIRRQKIRGELNAFKICLNSGSQRLDRRCFCKARHPFNEHVPAGEKTCQQSVNQFLLPHQGFAHLTADAVYQEMGVLDLFCDFFHNLSILMLRPLFWAVTVDGHKRGPALKEQYFDLI